MTQQSKGKKCSTIIIYNNPPSQVYNIIPIQKKQWKSHSVSIVNLWVSDSTQTSRLWRCRQITTLLCTISIILNGTTARSRAIGCSGWLFYTRVIRIRGWGKLFRSDCLPHWFVEFAFPEDHDHSSFHQMSQLLLSFGQCACVHICHCSRARHTWSIPMSLQPFRATRCPRISSFSHIPDPQSQNYGIWHNYHWTASDVPWWDSTYCRDQVEDCPMMNEVVGGTLVLMGTLQC